MKESRSTAPSRDEDRAPEATRSEHAFRRIRHDILQGELQPGEKLKIEALRNRYEIGPTPIREALSRLASSGLVLQDMQRGFRVAPMSVEELEDISAVRQMAETEALALSISHGDAAWESEVVRTFYKLARIESDLIAGKGHPAELWDDHNRDFHTALISAAQSPWLQRICRQLNEHQERYRRVSLRAASIADYERLHQEHRAIHDAALDRDAARATAMLREHIARTTASIRSAWLERAE
ncbi:FCD domain-containing protein [Aquicoccus sp. SCR17]|nr:FCD domain-containing protein [Carideicomes alvinocaridis]